MDIDVEGLAATADAIRAHGGRAETHQVDVRDRGGVQRACGMIRDQLGGIDYLFSNAGVVRHHPVATMPVLDWNLVIGTHLTGTFHLCQVALPHMVEKGRGAIVVTSSDYAIIGMRNGANYSAAKTGLYSLAKCLALEFAPYGIRVNAIGPGPIDTPLLRHGRTGTAWEEAARHYQAEVPMQRLGQPEEVAAVVDFLLSDRAAYITGQLVQPNGGQVMW
jgi:NAD(P)-dependent dehydrogenase (short-subunit alcohol dehydrogenase family)